jgi:peptide/nickel transport system permease protein
MLLLLVFVSAVTFIVFNVFPSTDPAVLRAGRQPTPAVIEQIRVDLGLDRPIYVQFADYVYSVFRHLDFGRSYVTNKDVLDQSSRTSPPTISLTIGGVVVWLTIRLSHGSSPAVRHRSSSMRRDRPHRTCGLRAPSLAGPRGLYLSARLGVFGLNFLAARAYVPFRRGPLEVFKALVRPWFVLRPSFAAVTTRLRRGSLLDVLSEDYIRPRAPRASASAGSSSPRGAQRHHAGR